MTGYDIQEKKSSIYMYVIDAVYFDGHTILKLTLYTYHRWSQFYHALSLHHNWKPLECSKNGI